MEFEENKFSIEALWLVGAICGNGSVSVQEDEGDELEAPIGEPGEIFVNTTLTIESKRTKKLVDPVEALLEAEGFEYRKRNSIGNAIYQFDDPSFGLSVDVYFQAFYALGVAPEPLQNAEDPDKIRSFLAGFSDVTDRGKKGKADFVCKTPLFRDALVDTLALLGFPATVTEKEPTASWRKRQGLVDYIVDVPKNDFKEIEAFKFD